jgi:imidazoleglycerol phosphate synthase glutamine amidotransferase subunit HisH
VYRAIGVQFHPEKSSRAGIRFLAAALEECAG